MENYNKASFGLRLLASLIDSFIFFIPIIILLFFLDRFFDVSNIINYSIVLFAVFFFMPILAIFYYSVSTSSLGGTLGKLILGLEVISDDGKRLNFKMSFLRHTLGYFVSSICLNLGYLWMLTNTDRKCWHDKLFNSNVINKSSNKLSVVLGIVLVIFFIVVFHFVLYRDYVFILNNYNNLFEGFKMRFYDYYYLK